MLYVPKPFFEKRAEDCRKSRELAEIKAKALRLGYKLVKRGQ